MADHTSTRVATRRKTPQPSASSHPANSPPRRTTRQTRSHSRDISRNGPDQVAGRQFRTRPIKANDNGELTVPARQTKHRAEPKNLAEPLADLTENNESPIVRYPDLPQDSHDEKVGAKNNQDTVRRDSGQTTNSTGRVSGFSGTTFRTSRSGQELSREMAEEMIYNLDDLSDSSDKILRLLLSNEISETSIRDIMARFSDPKSRETRQLERYNSAFRDYRDVYGGVLFIDVPDTVRNMLGLPKQESLQLGPWRVDPVLYKANLTATVRILMARKQEDVEMSIETLDRDFPRPFFQRFVDKTMVADTADASALLMDAFGLALDIRTRSFIETSRRLIDAPNFDPDSIVRQIFYNGGNMLVGWNAVGMRSQDLLKNPELRDAILNRLNQLRQTFSETESPYIDLDSLDRSFPQSRLLARLARWSQLRLEEIAAQLKPHGGAKSIADALKRALARDDRFSANSHSDHIQVHDIAGSAARTMPPPLFDLNSPKALPVTIGRLKEREAMRRASINQQQMLKQATAATTAAHNSTPASAPPRVGTRDAASSLEPPPWQPAQIDDEKEEGEGEESNDEPDNASLVQRIMLTQEKLNVEGNKENVAVQTSPEPVLTSQLHPRRGAQIQGRQFAKRIVFDSPEPEPSNARKSTYLSSQKSQVEAGGSQSEPSEDEGFQQDLRPMTKRSTTARKEDTNSANGQSPPKKARTGKGRREEMEHGGLEGAVQRHNTVNAPLQASQAGTYRLVNSGAKERVALRPKRTQTRKPWSEEEIIRLQELINEHGLSWSLLKKMDEEHKGGQVLKDRDQVALKDKARNMKLDYL
ncbi:MAG: hypothetical protein LQ349_003952, partial [Xanthoria aureola]